MTEWEYIWRQTYWAETGRSDSGVVQWVSHQHVWKPDLKNEVLFPDQDGIDRLGKAGWELVAMAPSEVSLVTRVSSVQGESYSRFTVYLLMFKRPVQ